MTSWTVEGYLPTLLLVAFQGIQPTERFPAILTFMLNFVVYILLMSMKGTGIRKSLLTGIASELGLHDE